MKIVSWNSNFKTDFTKSFLSVKIETRNGAWYFKYVHLGWVPLHPIADLWLLASHLLSSRLVNVGLTCLSDPRKDGLGSQIPLLHLFQWNQASSSWMPITCSAEYQQELETCWQYSPVPLSLMGEEQALAWGRSKGSISEFQGAASTYCRCFWFPELHLGVLTVVTK